MSSSTPQIRPAVPADIPGLVRLFRRHYTQYKPAAYFEWQYFSPEQPAGLSVAVDCGDVVGSFGFMRRELSCSFTAGQAMDMLLDTGFRGQGLFEEMARQAAAVFPDVQVQLVLANRAGMEAVTRRLGWSVVARVPLYTRTAVCGAEESGPVPDAARVESKGEVLRLVYHGVTEAWRFSAHPFHDYQGLETAGLRGHLKIFTDPADSSRRFGDILQVRPGEPARTDAWLRGALEWFRNQGIDSCGLWSLPGTPMAESALRVGFTPVEQERWLCVHLMDKTLEEELRSYRWDVCEADAEFY